MSLGAGFVRVSTGSQDETSQVGVVSFYPPNPSGESDTVFPDVSIPLTDLPNPAVNGIPAGYQLTISLQNDPQGNGNNITGVTYTIVDNYGDVSDGSVTLAAEGASSADLAPITAFQLNLVGPDCLETAALSSGAGTITYTASSPLTVLSNIPTQCTEWTLLTGEQANSSYGQLAPGPSNTFIQSFGVDL